MYQSTQALSLTTSASLPHPAPGSPEQPMLLVVSQERVGRAMAIRRLRANGFHTCLANDVAQAARRLGAGHQPVQGVLVVGTLTDGTADALRRWMRANGYPDLAIVTIGGVIDVSDPWAHTVALEDWDVEGPLGTRTRSLLTADYAHAPSSALAQAA